MHLRALPEGLNGLGSKSKSFMMNHTSEPGHIMICSGSGGRVNAMEEDFKDIEEMLRSVDYTKGSDHKERLKDKLFENAKTTQFTDELDLDAMKTVQAAVRSYEGIKKP